MPLLLAFPAAFVTPAITLNFLSIFLLASVLFFTLYFRRRALFLAPYTPIKAVSFLATSLLLLHIANVLDILLRESGYCAAAYWMLMWTRLQWAFAMAVFLWCGRYLASGPLHKDASWLMISVAVLVSFGWTATDVAVRLMHQPNSFTNQCLDIFRLQHQPTWSMVLTGGYDAMVLGLSIIAALLMVRNAWQARRHYQTLSESLPIGRGNFPRSFKHTSILDHFAPHTKPSCAHEEAKQTARRLMLRVPCETTYILLECLMEGILQFSDDHHSMVLYASMLLSSVRGILLTMAWLSSPATERVFSAWVEETRANYLKTMSYASDHARQQSLGQRWHRFWIRHLLFVGEDPSVLTGQRPRSDTQALFEPDISRKPYTHCHLSGSRPHQTHLTRKATLADLEAVQTRNSPVARRPQKLVLPNASFQAAEEVKTPDLTKKGTVLLQTGLIASIERRGSIVPIENWEHN